MLDIFLVILFFAAAVGFLVRRLVKTWRAEDNSSGGHCGNCRCVGLCSLEKQEKEQVNAK